MPTALEVTMNQSMLCLEPHEGINQEYSGDDLPGFCLNSEWNQVFTSSLQPMVPFVLIKDQQVSPFWVDLLSEHQQDWILTFPTKSYSLYLTVH